MDTHTPIPILFPKLQVPPSRLLLVSRESLLGRFNGGLHRKLTLISAPDGYGKTTLLSEWAARCEWRTSWVTLAAEDNEVEQAGFRTFWNCARDNLASIAQARRLGYRMEIEYRLHAWSMHNDNH